MANVLRGAGVRVNFVSEVGEFCIFRHEHLDRPGEEPWTVGMVVRVVNIHSKSSDDISLYWGYTVEDIKTKRQVTVNDSFIRKLRPLEALAAQAIE